MMVRHSVELNNITPEICHLKHIINAPQDTTISIVLMRTSRIRKHRGLRLRENAQSFTMA